MTEKQTSILGFITLAVILLAVWALFGERHGDSDLRGSRLLPDFAARADAVAGITLERADVATKLSRKGAIWTIAEKSGHQADSDKVRSLVAALASARIELIKTDDPELYQRIGLDDAATTLRLFDASGRETLALAIGERTYHNRAFSTYVRILPRPRSYLVTGLPEVRPEPSDWLPDMLFALSRKRLASVTVTHAESGETLVVSRKSSADSFGLEGMAETEVEAGFMAVDQMATSFTAISSDDVRPAAEIGDFPLAASIKVASFDGLFVTIRLHDTGDQTGDAWATIEASYQEPPLPDAAPQLFADAPADGASEAADIARRTEGWAYRLPAAKVASLIKERSALVRQQAPAENQQDKP